MEKETVRPSQVQVVEALQQKAQQDNVFNAVCYRLALRQRARTNITVAALQQAMEKEGYKYPKTKYAEVLIFLSSLGFGTIEKDNKGEIKSLSNIKVKLQDIGQASVDRKKNLNVFDPRPKFKTLFINNPFVGDAVNKKVDSVTHEISLTIKIQNTTIVLAGPFNLTPQQLSVVLMKFNQVGTKEEV